MQDLTNTGLSREFASAAAVERSNSAFHTIDFESGVTRAESGPQSRVSLLDGPKLGSSQSLLRVWPLGLVTRAVLIPDRAPKYKGRSSD